MCKKYEIAKGGRTTLTENQLEIAAKVAEGLTNQDIASDLGITVGTVKVHMRNICDTLGLDNRVMVARWYMLTYCVHVCGACGHSGNADPIPSLDLRRAA